MSEKIIPLKPTEEKTKSGKILLWPCLGPLLLMLGLIAISWMRTDFSLYLGLSASLTLVAIFFFGLKGLISGWVLEALVLSYAFSHAQDPSSEGPFLLLSIF